MTGSLLQLVAKGPDNLYLEGNPEISFFKIIYRRHTNFSMYPRYLKFNKTPTFGSTVRCKIKKDGDLATNFILKLVIPKLIVKYIVLTKDELYKRLLTYGVEWNYSGIPTNIVTIADYEEVIVLMNEYIGDANTIGTLLFELDDNIANKAIIDDQYINGTSTTGLEYANDVFQLMIVNNPLEVLYLFLTAYKQDKLNIPHTISTFDDILLGVYKSFINYIINNDPNFPYIKPNVNFYQALEFGNYSYNSSLDGTKLKIIFDTIGQSPDTSIDSYIVYNKYFNSLSTSSSQISSENDITNTLQSLLNTLEWNFRKNIFEIINIITLLRQNLSSAFNQFRIGIYKPFFDINGTQYDGTSLMTVVNTHTGDSTLDDFFSTTLDVGTLPNEPAGISHFFGSDIIAGNQTVNSALLTTYRASPIKEYLTDYNIWKNLKLSTFLGGGYATLDNSYVMNTIPYYIINDIPLMVNKYISESPIYSVNSVYFDLYNSVFANAIKADIIGMYNDYTNISNDIKTYLTTLDQTYREGTDKLLVALLKAELILNVDTSSFTATVIADANESNTNLISIEYVIVKYAYKYRQLIYDLTGDVNARKQLVTFIITNILNRFRMTNLPSYTNFKNNGYTLYGIETGTGGNNIIPQFLDAASSVWYNLNQQMISTFNNFFTNILVSPTYYQTKLGSNMVNALEYFKMMLQGNSISFDPNFINFDFYRLRLPDTAFSNLITIYNSMYDSYDNIFGLYNDQKRILTIKNASFNRSKNYYRRFDDMFTIISDELQGNPEDYYPIDYNDPSYLGIDIPLTLDAINASFVAQDIIGGYNVFDIVRQNLVTGVDAVISNSGNPYVNGTSLYDWFNTYYSLNMIDSSILDEFDTVMDNTYEPTLPYTNNSTHLTDPIDEFDTSAQFSDSRVRTIYGKFANDGFYASYMADKVIDNLDKFKKYLSSISINKSDTYNNFLTIVNTAITSSQNILNIIYNGQVASTDKYTGSTLDIELSKIIIGGQPASAWVKELGHYIIEKIHVEIGGQVIDVHVSEWLRLYHKITLISQKEDVYKKMIGNIPELFLYNNKQKEQYTLYIPLQFWFCRYIAEALPLIAMRYTNIDIVLKIRDLTELVKYDSSAILSKQMNIIDCKILAEYIYVDNEERKRLAENRHEYLIESTQSNVDVMFGTDSIVDGQFTNRLYFSNPCKLLIWSLKFITVNDTANDMFDWTNTNCSLTTSFDPIDTIKIQMNGTTREVDKLSGYYKLVQPDKTNCGSLDGNEFLYSFAIDPLKLQPSGAVNLSHIPDFAIIITLNDQIITAIEDNIVKVKWSTFNFSYNWLRVISGMSALSFFSS
jgi:hypothetical protein